MLNKAEEDYLKIIYELAIKSGFMLVKTNEISNYFGYSDQSVNEMIKKLEHKKLLTFMPYKGIQLTKKGEAEALRMIRLHRIWEVFLADKLGLSWENVHEDAEKLEHATSDVVLNKMYQFLGEPDYCQHGNPIPNDKGKMMPVSQLNLFDCEKGTLFLITRVLDDKHLLVYLNENGLSLNQEISITKKDDINGIIVVRHLHNMITLSAHTAKMIFGKKLNI